MKEEKEYSFFKKLIISIKDFEKYPELASKKWTVVLSYMIKLLMIFTIIVSFMAIYNFKNQVDQLFLYIKNEVPEFTFEDMKLKVNSKSPIIKENMDNLFETIIVDTFNTDNNVIETYKKSLDKVRNGIVFTQDKLFLKTSVTAGIVEYTYDSISQSYGIQNFDKNQFLEYFSGKNMILMYVGTFIMIFIYMFLIYITSIWLDIFLLAALGYITALMLRMRIRFSAMCKIVIHGLTLPILLNIVTILLETFLKFEVKYFDVMYITIAYIYIITAILMIKSDIIKNKQELAKIIEEQEKVRKELEKQKEEEESKKKEENQEKDNKENEDEKQEQKEGKRKNKKRENNLGDNPQGENA